MFRQDIGYEFFLKFALANQKDVGMVKLKRIILTGMEVPDVYFLTNKSIPNIIAMEKLERLKMDKKSSYILFDVSYNIFHGMERVYLEGMAFEQAIDALAAHAEKQHQEFSNLHGRNNSSTRSWRRIVHILRAPFILKTPVFRTIYNLFVYKKNSKQNIAWDLHSGNLMYRPSTKTIVLTDPLVGW